MVFSCFSRLFRSATAPESKFSRSRLRLLKEKRRSNGTVGKPHNLDTGGLFHILNLLHYLKYLLLDDSPRLLRYRKYCIGIKPHQCLG